MAAPPPQGESETTAITFGIAAMDEHLENVALSFPADRTEILRYLGDREIAYDPRGNTLPLETALQETGQEQFETRRELLNALHPVFEAKRKQGGVGGWLRSILPF